MFTSAECRAMAEQKLAQAERDDHQHRRRLLTAADAWLFLASRLREIEGALPTADVVRTLSESRKNCR
jgi:hypothetical protein